MASIEESIYTTLSTDVSVSALVSTRVYPLRLPQKPTYPAITYSIVAGEEFPAMSVNVDTTSVRVQISCWATSYTSVKSLSNSVKSAIDRKSGTVGTIEWKGSFKESEVDLYEQDLSINQNIYQKALDFRIFYD